MNASQAGRRFAIIAPIVAVALALALTGCGGNDKPATTTQKKDTAKGGLSVAQSALSTLSPDAKLLVVQTAQSVTPTATPVWAYLFGSQKDDKTYIVYVNNGKAMGAQEYGAAGLTKEQWAKVPDAGDWKIDSDAAFDKAKAVAGATNDPAAYVMGMQTFVPESAPTSQTTEAFTWYVSMDLGGGSAKTVAIDAKTGATVPE